jgi:signal transduction histidine kinase
MTASPVHAAPPSARPLIAAIALTCCLTVYVVAVPLLTHRGTVGWQLILTVLVAGIAAIGLLSMLWRLRRELAITREGFTRQAAEVSQLTRNTEHQAALARRQADEITALTAEITTWRKREQQRMSEFAELRDGHARQLESQVRSVTESVRYALLERIPAALTGDTPPPPINGTNPALAELLEQGMTYASESATRQQSVRSAVVAMSRRVQASAHRIQEEASLMADRHPGNADVLEVSMRVDHAAAQQARTAQSMAVLLGEWPGQQWPDALPLVDVVRAAAGRITAYRRVELAGDPDIAAAAPVVEPLIHLVAELLANATQSSPPTTQVPVTVRTVQRGAVIEIHDGGVGLDDYRLAQARAVATGETRVGLEDLGEVPQTGLAVVGQYVRRHGFRVDISESAYGGVRAVIGIPTELVETLEPAESASVPGISVPGSRGPESATAGEIAAGALPGKLPRRRSPRHSDAVPSVPSVRADASEPTADQATSGTRADGAIGAILDDSAAGESAQPTPEQAGAWMDAFLNATTHDGNVAHDGGSTGQGEGQ